uniref:Melanin-concentrating hormone receptor 1a n=1 Tax=Oncorhynchus tshawytscha TaxID=74940 RepID=A0A8C8FZ90_ONCTS
AIHDPYYNNVILPTIFGIICFLGIMGNCMVIYTIVDLLFLVVMPFLIHQLMCNGSWCFGATMCTVITALDSNSQIVSTYILTVMTLDRYLATVHPIRFNYVWTPCMATAVIVPVWTLSLLTIIPVWMYTGLMPLPGDLVGCALLLPDPSTDIYWFTLYQFILAFALPLLIICMVFFKILKHIPPSVAPLPPSVTEGAHQESNPYGGGPYYILQLVHVGVQNSSPAFSYAYNIAISMGYVNSCINPFLYIVLNETFKMQLILAMWPVHRKFRVNPASTTESSVCLRLTTDRPQQDQSSRELLPANMVAR